MKMLHKLLFQEGEINMKKLKLLTEGLITAFAYIIFPGWLFVVNAQTELDVDGINLETIRIPLFLPFDADFAESATVFSWLSFIGILATVALVIFWIFLILRTAVKAMQSRGESDGLQDVSKRFQSIFIGVFLTFLVPVILSVIGVLIGIGTIFAWPKMFTECRNKVNYQYYYQAYLELGESAAEGQCGQAADPGITR